MPMMWTPAQVRVFHDCLTQNRTCHVCNGRIRTYDENIEHVRTKRGTTLYIHTDCVKEWGR